MKSSSQCSKLLGSVRGERLSCPGVVVQREAEWSSELPLSPQEEGTYRSSWLLTRFLRQQCPEHLGDSVSAKGASGKFSRAEVLGQGHWQSVETEEHLLSCSQVQRGGSNQRRVSSDN